MIKFKLILWLALFSAGLFFYVSADAITYPNFSAESDDEVLGEIEHSVFNYYWNEINAGGYLAQDRARNFMADYASPVYTPIATGFGMVAACIGHKRGWITKQQAYDRINAILTAFYNAPESAAANPDGLVQHNGFFYHFVTSTGSRTWDSELSTIDTSFFVAGALLAGQYFKDIDNDSTLWNKADFIYQRINWDWMRNAGNNYLYWGWKPGTGFSGNMSGYSEAIFSYILAKGSPTHPLLNNGWNTLARSVTTYKNLSYIYESINNSFFVHQYPALFIDFSGKRDAFACYADNTYKATLHQHRYAYDNRSRFSTYGKYSWGLGATDNLFNNGYYAYGTVVDSGTVTINNLFTAITYMPGPVIASMRSLYAGYASALWGNYGFCDSFNTDSYVASKFNVSGMWRDPDIIGIQSGAHMIAIENYRSGMVRDKFSGITYVQNGLAALGFINDTSAPGAVSLSKIARLTADKSKVGQITLNWTAPGDDGYSTDISSGLFEVRFSTVSTDTWDTAPPNYLEFNTVFATNVVAGSAQSWTVTGLPDARYYYFWVTMADDCFNRSAASDRIAVSMSSSVITAQAATYNTTSSGTVILSGFEFNAASTTVQLIKQDCPPIPATGVNVADPNTLACTFDTFGKATGDWAVMVTTGGPNSSFSGVATVKAMAAASLTTTAFYPGSGIQSTDIVGEGFAAGSAVKLVKSGQNDIVASNISVISASKISFSFDTTGAANGSWDVVVTTESGGSTASAALAAALQIGYKVSDKQFVDKTKAVALSLLTEKGDIKCEIPAGTFSDDVNLTIAVSTVPASTKNAYKLTGIGIELSVDKNIQPSKEVVITLNYRDMDVAGYDEDKLVVGRYDDLNKRWIILPSQAYPSENRIVGITDHFSKFAVMQLVPTASLSGVSVFPNPFNPVLNTRGLTFVDMTAEAEIRIYNIAGELVREVEYTSGTGRAVWDGKNNKGSQVASGVYVALVKNRSGKKIIKIAVEK